MPRRADICDYFNPSMFRYYLRKKYKTRQPFAKRMGLSTQAVDSWVNGVHKPTWKHVIRMAGIFNISPRQLLVKRGRSVLDKWEDHLMDYLYDPPEVVKETTIVIVDEVGGSEKLKRVERSMKLTAKEAIELTEKLGIFDERAIPEEQEPDTNTYDPLKDLIEDEQ